MSEGRSFLRWAGSKRRLIPRLLPFWGKDSQRYIEPFMGSAALFFALKPQSAVLSDINSQLVETLCAVRDHPRAIFNRLGRFPLGQEAYYEIRQQDPSRLKLLDRAARFVYLNRFCFNGLYRTNRNGMFNVPYAASRTGQLPTFDTLLDAAQTLASATILTRDFEEAVEDVREGDFIYLDPPFAVQNRRIFRQYGPDTFGTDDLARLAATLPTIDRRGAKFLVSYAMCREATNAFRGWHMRRVFTQRSVAGFSKHRRDAVEILVSNRDIPAD